MARNSSRATLARSALQEDEQRRSAQLSDAGLFLRKFLAKGRTISAATPSSKKLVETVLRPVNFNRPCTIVELGAGTGPITQAIVDRIGPEHRFVAVENDPDFCKVLRRRFPDVNVLEADATRIAKPLNKMGFKQVDYVLSGLPTPNLPPRAMISLWRWLRNSMTPEGMFIQITVAPFVYKAFYERLFESVEYRMVWRNVPPGGVYYCAGPRQRPAQPRASRKKAKRVLARSR